MHNVLSSQKTEDDAVYVYHSEERAQHSAEATDDFKMSFCSSPP